MVEQGANMRFMLRWGNVFMAKYESETGDRLPAASVMTDRPASLTVQAAYLGTG